MLIDIRYEGGSSIIKGVVFHADRYQVRGGSIIKGVIFHADRYQVWGAL